MTNTIYELFLEKTSENTDKICICDENRALSRTSFHALIDTIAAKIPDSARRVGILMDHSVEMIAAIFAVLKSGRTYIPVEPFFPKERIVFMMRDAEADIVLTMTDCADKVADFPSVALTRGLEPESVVTPCRAHPESIAYVLYTSGSTGKPKGIAVRNENVCHYVRAFRNEFHPTGNDVMLQYSVCSFDIFVEEVFATLCSGATLAIPPDGIKKDVAKLMTYVDEKRITMISGFPYLLLEMNALPAIPPSLRLLISGGDVLRAAYVDRLVNHVEVYNTYGPSETTVCATYFRCTNAEPLADGTYPIGTGVLGAHVEILDENLSPVSAGETGEICITGGGVSSGYIGDRKKENEAFVTRADGTIVYRSGDLGYLLPDGNIAFLHRKDTQVMILGKRVETVEVESVLCKCPEIKAACVRPYVDEQNLSYLVAYVVLKQKGTHLSTLKKEMARFLPSYMIPEFFVSLPAIPLNANGKVDVPSLPLVMKEGVLGQ